MRRLRRGHLLVEAMAASAIALLVGAIMLSGLAQSSQQISVAVADQKAAYLGVARLEQLRASPLTSAAWTVGTTTTTPEPGYSVTTVVSAVSDAVAGAGTLSYRRAQVTVAYKGTRQYQVETFAW